MHYHAFIRGSSCFFHVFSSSFPQFGQRSHGVSPFCRMLESAQRRIDFGAVNLGDFVGQKFEKHQTHRIHGVDLPT